MRRRGKFSRPHPITSPPTDSTRRISRVSLLSLERTKMIACAFPGAILDRYLRLPELVMHKQLAWGVLVCSFPLATAVAQRGSMATAFRVNAIETGKNLASAAELMPDDKFAFKP